MRSHARGANDRLVRLYRGGDFADAERVIADALHRFDADLLRWLDLPPQTNEVGRAAPIMAALMLLAVEYRLPFQLIELGASAGLNLNLARFGYRLGGVAAGDPASPVQLAPAWDGASPPRAAVHVVDRCGVDQAPVHTADPFGLASVLGWFRPSTRSI